MFKKNRFVKLTSGVALSASISPLISSAGNENKDDKVDLWMVLKIAGLCLTGVGFLAYVVALFSRKSVLEKLGQVVSSNSEKLRDIPELKKKLKEKEKEKASLQEKQKNNTQNARPKEEEVKRLKEDRERMIEDKVERFVSDQRSIMRGAHFEEDMRTRCERAGKFKEFFSNEVNNQVDGLKKLKFKILKVKELQSGNGNDERIKNEIRVTAYSFNQLVNVKWFLRPQVICGEDTGFFDVSSFFVMPSSLDNSRLLSSTEYFEGILHTLAGAVSKVTVYLGTSEEKKAVSDFGKALSALENYCKEEDEFLSKELEDCNIYLTKGAECYLEKKVEDFRKKELSMAEKSEVELHYGGLINANNRIMEEVRKIDSEIKDIEHQLSTFDTQEFIDYTNAKKQYENLNKNKNFYKTWFLSEDYD